MNHRSRSWRALCLTLCFTPALLATHPAWADKPEWAGNGKGKHEQREDDRYDRRDDRRDDRHDRRDDRQDDRYDRRDDRRDERHDRDGYRSGVSAGVSVQLAPGVGVYFGTGQRTIVNDYYRPQFAAGKCPPGLAKKHNGCMPPGQAKKWAVGRRLPSDVVYYPLPDDLRRRMGPPPAGHEFVRVAGDILLIAVGTSMVIDAIEDLSR